MMDQWVLWDLGKFPYPLPNQPVLEASDIGHGGAGYGKEDVAVRRRIGPILLEILMWR
jgi:hypothetical protein